MLPKQWVDQLKERLGEAKTIQLDRSETRNFFQNFLDLFFYADEKEFNSKYEQHGALIFPYYIMKYLQGHLNPHSKTAKHIIELVDSLDELEKNSLKVCIEERLNDLRKWKKEEPVISVSTGVTAIAASAVTAYLSQSTPVSLFAGGFVMFSKKQYDDYQNAQREAYQTTLFDALKPKQLHHPINLKF